MRNRWSRLVAGVLVFAVLVLIARTTWAIFDDLGPSQDEWKMKYDVQVTPAEGDKLNVAFSLADEGRLKPIYSVTVITFTKADRSGARSYLVKEKIDLKPDGDGHRGGQVQIPKQYAQNAILRVLTQTVDGKRWTTANAAFYDIPLKNFLNQAPAAASRAKPSAPK